MHQPNSNRQPEFLVTIDTTLTALGNSQIRADKEVCFNRFSQIAKDLLSITLLYHHPQWEGKLECSIDNLGVVRERSELVFTFQQSRESFGPMPPPFYVVLTIDGALNLTKALIVIDKEENQPFSLELKGWEISDILQHATAA